MEGKGRKEKGKRKEERGVATRSQYFGVELPLVEVAVLLRIRARTLAVMKTYSVY